MMKLDAYAADWRVHGQVEFGEGRLSDQLKRVPELHLRDARLEDLGDGQVVAMSKLKVALDELCAVVATGPRGDVARRLNTQTARVEVEVGPYRIVGWVHGTPVFDPVASVLRRGTWVPLTEVSIRYRRGADDVSEEVETLLVNSHLMRLFRAF